MAGKSNYLGPDRRKEPRRQKGERRTDVRWEGDDKESRRESYGRRKDDRTWRLPKKS